MKRSDWYRVARADLIKQGGGQLFVYYPSLPALLQSVFPDFEWAPARFSESAGKMPNGFWNQDNLLAQLKIAEQKLAIQNVRTSCLLT